LQEVWVGAARLTVAACQDKIRDQDGYIGLFGYRYGWQPFLPDSEQSITHFEWEFAIGHWPLPQPPIFIFLPSPGEEADRDLKRRAQDVLEDMHPDSESERQASLDLQHSFLQQVRRWAGNRFINFYATARELREKAIASVNHWNRDIWKQAALGRAGTSPPIPEAELGAIGREDQLQALAQFKAGLEEQHQEVAAAFVIHGEENQGQRHFATFLPEWEEWEDGDLILGPFRPDRPEEPEHLARWICEWLDHPAALAEAMTCLVTTLSTRLRDGHVVVILQSLGKAPDRWHQFWAGFWKPLRERLGQAVSPETRGRLIMVVVDHEPCAIPPGEIFHPLPSPLSEAALGWDTTRPIPLPELRCIDENHVKEWLRIRKPKLNGQPIKHHERARIAAAVIQQDGLPVLVFERLQGQGLWHFPS
ncbi:MAG: DUF4062 domain-containing protein, partial [Cyanobacteriota bacterium]